MSLVFLLAGAGTVFGLGCYTQMVSVINKISFGDVNIGLKEYEIKEGKRQVYESPKIILPGDTISKIPCIINYAEPCWVRIKLEYMNPENTDEKLDDSCIRGISVDWIKKGDYFYYTKILQKKEQTDVFQEVLIPDTWDSLYEQKEFGVLIRVEAIQAKNYSPDFSDVFPWGNMVVQKCIHGTDDITGNTIPSIHPMVEFRGAAQAMVAVPDDFFEGLGEAMPGDTKNGSVQIKNTSDIPAELFFRTELPSQNEKQTEFLKKINLLITYDGKKLYEGNLAAEERNREISLGTYRPGEERVFQFNLYFPKELDNAFAKRTGNVKWIFSALKQETVPSVTPYKPETTPGRPDRSETPVKTVNVKTGDSSNSVVWVKIAAASLILAILLLFARRRRDMHK